MSLVLHVEQAAERRGQLGAVRNGRLQEIGGTAVVVATVPVPKPGAADGVTGCDSGQYGESRCCLLYTSPSPRD